VSEDAAAQLSIELVICCVSVCVLTWTFSCPVYAPVGNGLTCPTL